MVLMEERTKTNVCSKLLRVRDQNESRWPEMGNVVRKYIFITSFAYSLLVKVFLSKKSDGFQLVFPA